jgi:hypothetical protein
MLIKRLSPEVKALYCVLELVDAVKILDRHNADPEKQGIDLVSFGRKISVFGKKDF